MGNGRWLMVDGGAMGNGEGIHLSAEEKAPGHRPGLQMRREIVAPRSAS